MDIGEGVASFRGILFGNKGFPPSLEFGLSDFATESDEILSLCSLLPLGFLEVSEGYGFQKFTE